MVNDFVGVVADSEWNATKAAKALVPALIWSDGDPLPAQADLYTYLTKLPSRDSLLLSIQKWCRPFHRSRVSWCRPGSILL